MSAFRPIATVEQTWRDVGLCHSPTHLQQSRRYSITSSAEESSDDGISQT
jgi:hypothetical protein